MFTLSRDRIEALEKRIGEINEILASRATDSEEIARNAAINAIDSKNQAEDGLKKINETLAGLERYSTDIAMIISDLDAKKKLASESFSEIDKNIKSADSVHEEFLNRKQEVDENISELATSLVSIKIHLEEASLLPQALESAQNILAESAGVSESIKNAFNHALKKKSEIDDIYKEILGEDIKSEDGEVNHINGIKDDLEDSFSTLSEKVSGFNETFDVAIKESNRAYESHMGRLQNTFDKLIANSTNKFNEVNEQLIGLLPGSMAAGLSAAYEKKKEAEEGILENLERRFRNAILGLVLVSLIPFAVDIFLLAVEQRKLVDVIKDTPSLIVAILPIYFPILWLAYSASKKSNLSKRLIEEYTHKAVLGKTFSGLSNQIETLEHQGTVKEELRIKLLFNVLQVSSENPGKLITDYNKSDHPLMDVLESSSKLSDAVNSLSKIPGFSSVANQLNKHIDKKIEEQSKKIDRGIAINTSINEGLAKEGSTKEAEETTL